MQRLSSYEMKLGTRVQILDVAFQFHLAPMPLGKERIHQLFPTSSIVGK